MLELYRLELETRLATAERERRLSHLLSLRAARLHAPVRHALRPRLAAALLALASRLDPAPPEASVAGLPVTAK